MNSNTLVAQALNQQSLKTRIENLKALMIFVINKKLEGRLFESSWINP